MISVRPTVSWSQNLLVDSDRAVPSTPVEALDLSRGTHTQEAIVAPVSGTTVPKALGPKRDPACWLSCHQGARFVKGPVCFRHHEAPGYRDPGSVPQMGPRSFRNSDARQANSTNLGVARTADVLYSGIFAGHKKTKMQGSVWVPRTSSRIFIACWGAAGPGLAVM